MHKINISIFIKMLSQLGYFSMQVSKEQSPRYLYETADTVLYSRHKNVSRGELTHWLHIFRFIFTIMSGVGCQAGKEKKQTLMLQSIGQLGDSLICCNYSVTSIFC